MRAALRDPRLPVVALAFFLSGAAALAYQVAWQRLLALQTGVGVRSVAVIVAAFMLGLGLGSHVGGVLSARLGARRSLVGFALCELGIAACGAVSVPFLYGWLYRDHVALFTQPWLGALVQLLSLLPPTTLMGMSLPLLSRAMVRDRDAAAGIIAFLYGINMLGAAAGALATPWLLIRHHGLPAAVHGAAAANLVAGLAALVLLGWRGRETGDVPAVTAATPADAGPGASATEAPHSFRSWVALYALSGFVALSLEILWFRLMDVAVKSTAYTFGTLLALYLLGTSAGSLAGLAVARHIGRPRRAFLLLQCAIVAYAALVVAIAVRVPPDAPGYAWYYELWGGQRSFNLGGALHVDAALRLYVLLPLVLFGPATFLMGLAYPVLQRAVQDDPLTSGRKVGTLQAANIAGCVLGSLIVGLFALDVLGSTGTLRALVLFGLGFAALGARAAGQGRTFAALAVVLVVLAVLVPDQRRFWMRLHGTQEPKTLLEEDATGVAALVPDGGRWHVWAGGRTHSELPFGGLHTTLGAAPVLVHPAPAHVAIVGLGSGDTADSSACRYDVAQRVTVFELYAPEHRLLSALAALPGAPPPRLRKFLSDPRLTLRIADGRNALQSEDALYDVIEADALWPTTPYAGNLYSLEFFRMCARRLRPGGLVCTWSPTPRVRATFTRALPHVVEIAAGRVLLGSDQPIRIDLPAWRARLDAAPTRDHLGARARGVWDDLSTAAPVRPSGRDRDANLDLFPRDEFHTPD